MTSTHWFISTSQLELVSLDFCRVCREVPTATGVVNCVDDLSGMEMREVDDIVLQGFEEREQRLLGLPPFSPLHVKFNCLLTP